jgi:hypothetical protein
MRDRRDGHITPEQPYGELPRVNGRAAVGVLTRTAAPIDDHVDRLLRNSHPGLWSHSGVRQALSAALAPIPPEHAATLGKVDIKSDKDPRVRASYTPKRYSTRKKGYNPAHITLTPQMMSPDYEDETQKLERDGILAKTGLPAMEHALHHEVGHHLYAQMRNAPRDAMWNEIGAQPEFKAPNPESVQPVAPRFMASNKSNLTKHVSAYAATSHEEASAELYAQHFGQHATEASHIAFRHLTGENHDISRPDAG